MIRKKRFQNHIAESGWLLSSSLLLCAVLWWFRVEPTVSQVLSYGCYVSAFFILRSWTGHHSLLRTKSDMIPASWAVVGLLMHEVLPAFNTSGGGNAESGGDWALFAGSMLIAACISCLMKSYRSFQAESDIFKALLCLSLLTFSNAWIILLVPAVWHIMYHQLQCFTLRTLVASLLGLLLPYWLLLGVGLLIGVEGLTAALNNPLLCEINAHGLPALLLTGDVQGADFVYVWQLFSPVITTLSIVVSAFIALSLVAGSVHYVRSGHSDKGFTRTMYQIFIICSVLFLLAGMVVWSMRAHFMLFLSVTLSPLMAHLFTHTYTRWTNRMFKLWLLLLVLIWLYSLWMG